MQTFVHCLRDSLPPMGTIRSPGFSTSTLRWLRAGNVARKISPAMTHRILDPHAVLARALQIFAPSVATQWLVGHEPFLNEARPIDVLAVRGAAPLIEALDAIAAGAYA